MNKNANKSVAELERQLAECSAQIAEERAYQDAIVEVLRVISESPTDLQPVFDVIVERARALCDAAWANTSRFDGEVLHLMSVSGRVDDTATELLRGAYPMKLDGAALPARAVASRTTVQVADLSADPSYNAQLKEMGRRSGLNSVLAVPMIRGDTVLGTILVSRAETGTFPDKFVNLLETFATQAVIAIDNVQQFNETQAALERQTATAEILQVISSSPTDVQPVFEAIAERARKLANAMGANTCRFDGELLHIMAVSGELNRLQGSEADALEMLKSQYPMRPDVDSHMAPALAVLNRAPYQIQDIETDPLYPEEFRRIALKTGVRSVLAVPMLRDNEVLGTILVAREYPGAFADDLVVLLETFAAQAVIAIANVRQFNETQEALERQTATAEILRVISKSPNDVQPVFDAIAQRAMTLCGALGAAATRKDGDMLHAMATAGGDDVVGGLGTTIRVSDGLGYAFRDAFPTVISREGLNGRAVLERAPVQIPDIDADPELGDAFKQGFEKAGARSGLAVPMLQGNEVLGTIMVLREETGLFPDKLVSLLQTFADQAVIAIENVRLFNETNEALERQTATAEILQVISGSPTDVQPVFDAIAERAKTLCEALGSVTARFDGEMLHAMASAGDNNVVDGISAAINKAFPMPISRAGLNARAVLERTRVQIPDIKADSEYANTLRQGLEEAGARSALAVPMLRDDNVLGTIMVFRKEPGLFPDKLVQLLETFADQAVIAVENVRLFNETQNALERQTATAEILKTISASPTDVQPVFEAIAERAVAMSNALGCVTTRFDGELIHAMAYAGGPRAIEGLIEGVVAGFPMAPGQASASARAVADRATSQIPDIERDPEYAGPIKDRVLRTAGARSALAVPMIRDSEILGTITLIRSEVGNFPGDIVTLVETFADQAVIAIENVRLFNETEEALERQTAISDILRVISESPTNVQPVFDAIASRAMTLCDAEQGATMRFDGERLHIASAYGFSPERIAIANELFPAAPSRATITGRAVLERAPVQIPDILADEEFKLGGAVEDDRSMLAVPLIREGEVIGAITVGRKKVGLFPDSLVSLLKTFADQAVIAIENVRLFNETEEALERQTAISDILRVISESPTDVHPVFDAIAERAMALCDAQTGATSRFDGKHLHLAATYGFTKEIYDQAKQSFPLEPSRKTIMGRAVLERSPVEIPDISADPEFFYPAASEVVRSMLAVPLVREGVVLGAIAVGREQAGSFPDKLISLLQTFADQAVIAIENVRLFNETQEALEQQTAISEVLRVISESPTDVQPVFDAIAERAMKLCGAEIGVSTRFDGELMHLAGAYGFSEDAVNGIRDTFPLAPDRTTISGRTFLERAAVQIPDMKSDTEYGIQAAAAEAGSTLAVPLMRDQEVIGSLAVARKKTGFFPEKLVSLLETFADQAVIAIENVRLFNETEEALEQQTAISDVLRVISESPTDVTPVFKAIAERAMVLCDGEIGVTTRFDGKLLHLETIEGLSEKAVEASRAVFPVPVDRYTISGQAVLEKGPVQRQDLLSDPDYRMQTAALETPSLLAVPLIREGHVIGTIAVGRKKAGAFPDKQVKLLQTFADQAVIAIENVRLFNETKEALDQQTAVSEILRVTTESPTDEQPILEAIADHAVELCDATSAAIYLLEGETLRHVVSRGATAHVLSQIETVKVDRTSTSGRAVLDRKTVHVEDMQAEREEYPRGYEIAVQVGHRTIVVAPLMREGEPFGAILLRRAEVRPFSDREIALLRTFGDQAAIALQNVRLFNETKEALEQQTATADILKVISSSPTNLDPVFEAIADRALALGEADVSGVMTYDGETIDLAHGVGSDEMVEAARNYFPKIPDRRLPVERVVLDRAPVIVGDVLEDPEYSPLQTTRKAGIRSVLAVPMLKEGKCIGSVGVFRRTPGAFPQKLVGLFQTFADQAVIAIENARLFNETNEALEQLTATAEVLRVISSSIEDTGPVFDKILDSCQRIFSTEEMFVNLIGDDGLFHYAAVRGEAAERVRNMSIPAGESLTARGIRENKTLHVPSVEDVAEMTPTMRAVYEITGNYSTVLAPMVREGRGIGSISLVRHPPKPFTEKEISLLTTFADQAVIAIENARLFNETKEALEQQTATSEVLSVISSSVEDTTPVFDTIIERCTKLFRSEQVNIFRVLEDGQIDLAAARGEMSEILSEFYPRPLADTIHGLAIENLRPVHYSNVELMKHKPRDVQEIYDRVGNHSVMAAPMMWEGRGIGTIVVGDLPPRPFSDKEISVLGTFADQAVIAIQNARLINETREALEQQTATSDILKVISSSPTDLTPIFQEIADRGRELVGADISGVFLYDGKMVDMPVSSGASPALKQKIHTQYPMAPFPRYPSHRAIIDRAPVQVVDLQHDPIFEPLPPIKGENLRSALGVPMMKEGNCIGSIAVLSTKAGGFSDKIVQLFQTFADQAVIAIENARLFNETKEALEQQTATAEVLRVISRSVEDTAPVFEKILDSCRKLFAAEQLNITMIRDDGQLHIAALRGEFMAEAARAFPMPLENTVTAIAIKERRPVHYANVDAMSDLPPSVSAVYKEAGNFSIAIAPMILEKRAVGSLVAARIPPKPFTDKEISLLTTFADQAVIAIENARLFREIEDKSQQLAIANQHKSEFLANMSHELRTPLNAIIGFSEVLLERMFGELNDKQDDYLKDIYSSGKHLLALINDILDLSKIEAGRMELDLEVFDVAGALENAMTLVRERAQQHGIALTLDAEQVAGEMRADERKFKQIMLNLLSNAVKFTPDGGSVSVRGRLDDQRLEVAVSDTGIGISEQDQDAIFEEFQQVGGDYTNKQEGTGLGLSLTRRFVELHGGELSLTSELEKGSTFTFTLPRQS